MKRRLLEWLGILKLQRRIDQQQIIIDILNSRLGEESLVGVNVHMRSPSFIIIFTRAAGGQIRFMDIDIKSMRDLNRITEQLQIAYGVSKEQFFYDAPDGFPPRKEWRDY